MAKDPLRAKILKAALPDVPFDGWTEELLARAGEKEGVSQKAMKEAFPGGVADLARYFSRWADDEMQKRLARQKGEGGVKARTRDKVALAVRTRLEILAPWKPAVSSALAFLALPPRNFRLPSMLWRTADRIWICAGDTSRDYNRYTKRFLLSGVLAATTLYWLDDASEGHARTWDFLTRRIDNVVRIGRTISSLSSLVGGKESRA
jgi:ubiquinone biosynthesis protein COQ9